MEWKFMKALVIAVSCILLACGSGKSNKSSPSPEDGPGQQTGSTEDGNLPPFNLPESNDKQPPTQTQVGDLSELPPNWAEDLNNWLKKTKKSCDFSAIFAGVEGDGTPLAEAWDLSMLLKATGSKLWLRNDRGDILVLSKPFIPRQTGFANRNINKNGSSISLSSNLDWTGICTLRVNNKLVASVPLTSGFGVTGILQASEALKIDAKETSQPSLFSLTNSLSYINLKGLDKLSPSWRFQIPTDAAQFSIPGYDLGTLLSKVYSITPDSVVFNQDERALHGWLATNGALDEFMPKMKPSWIDDYVTHFAYVPTLLDSIQLQQMNSINSSTTEMPVQWLLNFTAWEADQNTGGWVAKAAQITVKGVLQSFRSDTASQEAGLQLNSISQPAVMDIPGQQVQECVRKQVDFWLEALKEPGYTIMSPTGTLFPCERLPGTEKRTNILELYKTDESIKASINKVLSNMPGANSQAWYPFNIALAKALGGDSFPLGQDGVFLQQWRHYYDAFIKINYKGLQAIELSAAMVHGNKCKNYYADTALATYATSFLAASNSSYRSQAILNLWKTCPQT
jgi:hypothetical protein